jgi:hypothetical protein
MTAAVFTHIAEYFKKIHAELVWPTASSTPAPPVAAGGPQNPGGLPVFGQDRLHELRRALLFGYVKAIRVFEVSRSCAPGEDCLPTGNAQTSYLVKCNSNDDCPNQGEVCIGGFCVPDPYELDLATNAFVPDQVYLDSLQAAFHGYYAQIQSVLTAGLGRNPSKLPEVRDHLMDLYSTLAKVAGKPECKVNSDCAEGKVCVQGICTPYPFRLIFRMPGGPLKAPWTL